MSRDATIEIYMKMIDEATGPMKRSLQTIEQSTGFLQKSLRGLNTLIVGAGLGFGVKQLIQTADTYQLLSDRIGIVTKSEEERLAVEKELFNISQRTRTAYEDTLTIYARMARSAKDLGVSHADLLQITETINKSMLVSGATTQEASAAMIQFSQAMASGELRGEELRSVLEQTPRLSKAIADGLGVTIGKLREMSKEGELTAGKVLGAIKSQHDVIGSEYGKMSATVGQSIVVMTNSLGMLLHRTDESGKATNILAKEIIKVSESLDEWGDKNKKLIDQKVPEYVQKVYGTVKDLVGLFDSLPDGSTKAAIFGLLTGKVFGPVVGASVGAGTLLGEQRRESIRKSMRDYTTMPDSSFEDELGPKPAYEELDQLLDWIKRKAALIEEMKQQDMEIASRYSTSSLEFVGPPSPKSNSSSSTSPAWESKDYYEEANRETAEFNKLLAEGEQLTRSMMTPAEEYAAKLRQFDFLYGRLVIGQETYNRSMEAAKDQLSQAMWEIKNAGSDKEWADFNALQSETESIFRSVRTPAEEYVATLERLSYLYESTSMSMETFSRATGVAADEYKKAVEKMEEDTNTLSEFQKQAFRNMESFAGDFFYDLVKGRNEDLLGSFIDMTQRMVAEWMSAQATMAMFGESYGKTGEVGGILGPLLNYFTTPSFNSTGSAATGNYGPMPPGRAAGGSVYSGQTYVVGERGPELLKMGNNSGTVIPNGGGGMQSLNVNIRNEGSSKKATDAKIDFDFRGAVVSVVLQDAEENGPIKAAFGGARF